MKILYLITKGNWGGAQRYVYELSTSLSPRHDISVITGPGVLGEKLTQAGIKTEVLSNLKRDVDASSDLSTFLFLLKYLRKHKPDLVHLNSSKIGAMGSLAAKLVSRKTKVVFTSHGWAFNEDRPFWQKQLIRTIHLVSVLLSDKTIAVSKSLIRPYSAFAKRFTHIPLGIEIKSFLSVEGARSELLQKVHLRQSDLSDKNPLWIGTIGELHKNKGHTFLIKSLARVSFPFIAFIIGEGEEREHLTKLVKGLGLEKKVFLVGAIPEAYSLLKGLDLFVLPSTTESFGYVVLEAGLAQRPVIASQVGGLPEIITQLEDGLLTKPRDTRDLTRALEYLQEDKEKRHEIARNLREKVLRDYSKSTMIANTEKVYLELTSPETHSS